RPAVAMAMAMAMAIVPRPVRAMRPAAASRPRQWPAAVAGGDWAAAAAAMDAKATTGARADA
ncbi:hypothetical protein NK922_23865, partial [Salmonella enterica subsp. enterica serovar Typhimurium]|uniref:hypothetical protein n=1 Tax=Salmonella enterica TaxID=28901 RepID=UPI0020A415C4